MTNNKISSKILSDACEKILKNKALIITVGGGMGVDSGLPDFRKPKGFLKCFPHLQNLSMNSNDFLNPNLFNTFPNKAWYFYGYRFNLYKETKPHHGYKMLHDIGKTFKNDNYIVITTNIDGHFHQAGFPNEKIFEIKGSINYLQCNNCIKIYSAEELGIKKFILDDHLLEIKDLPKCKNCDLILKPNVFLTDDDEEFIFDRFLEQSDYFEEFMVKNKKEGITIMEIDVGINFDLNLRMIGDNLYIKDNYPATVIRINPINESLIINEMHGRNLITRERYYQHLDGDEIDVEKELQELSKNDDYETSEYLKLNSSRIVQEKQESIKYIRKLIDFEKKTLSKSTNQIIEIKSSALNAINEIYNNLGLLRKV